MTNKPIEYRYLNMDTKKFHPTEVDLLEYFRGTSASIMAIPNYDFNNPQCLIVCGERPFTKFEAIRLSRTIGDEG